MSTPNEALEPLMRSVERCNRRSVNKGALNSMFMLGLLLKGAGLSQCLDTYEICVELSSEKVCCGYETRL